ncbi:glycosyltransferase family 4 protein [Sphingopyxis sp. USTB-05]|uniref:glycosyltransferase family 4 protein n=1 Tax=Sphingopyxis sp. USTB-05 TaxID=2830667 RepID=UPI002078B3E1|nr:glycosyltransferase family 4 protein [Sphingopyxis sp. USTB-05]USI78696.1 glycosyltransferase family 4 protein [Sphingopyxis sp. USTB-05]
MKILFLVSSMQGGGAERVAALLANAWAEHGHNVTLMPTFSARGECVYSLNAAVHLDFLSDHCEPGAGRLARLTMLRRFIRSFNPDVIVSFLPHVNVAAILAAWGSSIPVIACERIYPPVYEHLLPRAYRALRKLLYPVAAALVGQTEPASEWLRERGGKAIIATIPNPVLLPLPKTEPYLSPDLLVPPDSRLLLWVGRLDDQKRPELLIEAVKLMGGLPHGWQLVMLGDGTLREKLENMVEAAGLSGSLILPGFAGNLGDWYRRADLFVMTSSFEGFPNALLEAMAHGVAPIAFDVSTGPAELSDGGQRIMLLPDDRQLSRLSEALRCLTSDTERRRALAERASQTAETFSLEAILSQWDALFATVIDRSHRRGKRSSS